MFAQLNGGYLRTRFWKAWSRLVAYLLFEGRPLTTRGRWINPMLFFFFRIIKRLPQLVRVSAPIFILGTGRSGTTILGVVLSMHKAVGFLNEPKALWHSIRSDEDLIGSYSRGEARYRLTADDAGPDNCDAARKLFGAYLRLSGSRRLVDKYPELIFRVPFVCAIFPDALFLFLSRDGWDTCASIDLWSSRLGKNVASERHDWWGVDRRKWRLLVEQVIPEHPDLAPHGQSLLAIEDHKVMAAVEWIVTMREGLRLVREYPDFVMHVNYGDFCESPRAIASRIADFTGLSTDEVYLRYASAVLAPAPPRSPFELPDFVDGPFSETQSALGYDKRAIV